MTSGAVSAGVAVYTAVVSLDVGSVTSGERIYVRADVGPKKGATAGRTLFEVIQSSGTATVSGAFPFTFYQDANADYYVNYSNFLRVTGSGTLVIVLRVYPYGSGVDFGVPGAGSAALQADIYR